MGQNRNLTGKHFSLVAGSVALGALALLAGALVFEHGIGLLPCHLCLLQRGPHVVATILAGTAALTSLAAETRLAGRILLIAAGVTLLGGAELAVYHVGVESHWWAGPTSCTGIGDGVPDTTEDFLEALRRGGVVQCDTVPWSLFGISLAGYNALASVTLGVSALFASAFWRGPRHGVSA